ncbi:MAG: hypothetical protein J6V88_00010 [Kiritimatiellae bacterium]|nr:hypothetical protein [Kiritimatiellia bacterium]
MKRLSFRWPIFIVVASVSVALTWKLSPLFLDILPESTLNAAAKLVSYVTGQEYIEKEVPAQEDEVIVKTVTITNSPSLKKSVAAKKKTPSSKTAVKQGEEAFSYPDELGIRRVGSNKAQWGVTRMVSEIERIDGKAYGNVKGGRIFIPENRIKDGKTTYLIGNFFPKKLETKVRVNTEFLICFSGDPKDLSEKQRLDLRNYYELAGEAEARKIELLKKAASKSPYIEEAVASLKKLRNAEQKISKMTLSEDDKRKATYKLSQLRTKVQELNEKHKQWKKENEDKLAKYEEDPEYIRLKENQQKYTDSIPGLDF